MADTITLREYLDTQLAARDRAHSLQAGELDRRLEELNHNHQRNTDDRNQFLTKDSYEKAHGAIVDKIDTIVVTIAENRGRDKMVAALVAVVTSLVTGLVMLVISHAWK